MWTECARRKQYVAKSRRCVGLCHGGRTGDGDGVEVGLQILEVEREVEDVHVSDGLRDLWKSAGQMP